MRTSLTALALVIGTAQLCGCGGSSSGSGATLDCAYVASDNCWKTTTAAALSCLPDSADIGTLSADGSTCTYASGHVVTFTPPVLPLPTSTTTTMAWNFTVTTGSGAPCLSYKDDGNGNLTLNVQGQIVKQTAPGGFGIALACPDGTTYSNSNGFNLLSCPDASFFSSLPGNAYSESTYNGGASISLSLTGVAGSDGSEPVFNCKTTP
jgi:hypothetical protein